VSQQPEHPEQILNRPVGGEDLTEELKQTKRSVSKLTLGLGAGVLVVAAFFGGVATHAAVADKAQPAAQGNNRPRQFPGAGQGGQNGQGGGGFRGGTVGTIDHVDGKDVYVKTPDGKTVKVSTSDSTQVRISQQGAVTDLKAGETVVVQGSTGSDGTVTAQTITQGLARGQ
jgi:hypothetical protein